MLVRSGQPRESNLNLITKVRHLKIQNEKYIPMASVNGETTLVVSFALPFLSLAFTLRVGWELDPLPRLEVGGGIEDGVRCFENWCNLL